mgnify:CR=1 FL=1
MSLWHDFLSLWHEWTATDDEDFFVNCGAQDDESAWYGSDEPFRTFVTDEEPITLNPATGLMMFDGPWGVDIGGNPYGYDLDDHHQWDDNHDWPTDDFNSDPW